MTDSLRILLAESIDYAGLFPPAQLSLKHAVNNYARCAQSSERWMLARMVVPVSQLANPKSLVRRLTDVRPPPQTTKLIPRQLRNTVAEQVGIDIDKLPNTLFELEDCGADSLDTVELVMELEKLAEFDSPDDARIEPLIDTLAQIRHAKGHRLAVIATAGETSDELLDNLRRDVQAMVAFRIENGDRIKVDTLEIKVPSNVFESSRSDSAARLIDAVHHNVSVAELSPISIFFEVPICDEWERNISSLLEQMDTRVDRSCGLKIRTGSLNQSAVISTEQLAYFINSCRAAGVAWKATAGLHHPLRHFDDATQIWQFGFLNLLTAAVFDWTHELSREQLLPILTETSIGQFTFDNESMSWGDYRATLDEIERARQETMISFGSCSFDEPCEGLRDLLLIA